MRLYSFLCGCCMPGQAGVELLRCGYPPGSGLLPLPAYSPELNPVEHIWEHLRENYFGHRVFPSLSAVVD